MPALDLTGVVQATLHESTFAPHQWCIKPSTTVGLTYGFYGGVAINATGVVVRIADGTVLLTDNAVNYVEHQYDGTVTANTAGFTGGGIKRMAKVTTLAGVITAYEDWRNWGVSADDAIPKGNRIVRTLATYLDNNKVFNAKDYIDSTTLSVSTAIQACWDEAQLAGAPVRMPFGTYLIDAVLNWPTGLHVFGDDMLATVLKMKNGANLAAVVQSEDFASLTGTTSNGGIFAGAIRHLKIDGNKANNPTGGRSLQVYGRMFTLEYLALVDAKTEPLYTECGGAGSDDFSTFEGIVDPTISHIFAYGGGGSGWVCKGPHDQIVSAVDCIMNGGWGIDCQTPIHGSQIDTFLNTLGGIKTSNGGCIIGSDIAGTTGTGIGFLADTLSGTSAISGIAATGPVGLKLRTPSHRISGFVGNTTVAGVQFDGGSANLDLTMSNNQGDWFDCTNQGGDSVVTVQSQESVGTLFKASTTPQGDWTVVGAKKYKQIATTDLMTGQGYAVKFPATTAMMAVMGAQGAAYGATIDIFARFGNHFIITPTNGTAFTINNPTDPLNSGQEITIEIKNTFGTLGTVTWSSQYKMAAWTNPANGFSRAITFKWNGSQWREVSRTPSDVPN